MNPKETYEALEIRRYASPACDDPVELVEKMTADLRIALKKNPELSAGIVQDGVRETRKPRHLHR